MADDTALARVFNGVYSLVQIGRLRLPQLHGRGRLATIVPWSRHLADFRDPVS